MSGKEEKMDELMMSKTYFHFEAIEASIHFDHKTLPITCEVDVSNVCNLECSFCMFADYRAKNNVMMDYLLFESLIYQLNAIGCKSITFTGGGEPTMNPDFQKMVRLAAKYMHVGLVTNGVKLLSLNSDLLKVFKFIRVSLDASDSKMYKLVKGKNRFDVVVQGMKYAKSQGAFVGASYVICPENETGITVAKKLADVLNLEYIQFKPMVNITEYKDYTEDVQEEGKTIYTGRWKAESTLPCKVAGLVGVVTADGGVAFCCQHRGRAVIGNLHDAPFDEIYRNRMSVMPDYRKCPPCRYMAYVRAYQKFNKEHRMFWEHRQFM